MWEIIIKRDGHEINLKCVDEGFNAEISREIVYDDLNDKLVSSLIKHLNLRGIMV